MNRHPFRWDAIAFGLFFLAVLGQWAVWEHHLLSPDDLAFVAAAALIALGILGIVGTAISARSDRRKAPFTPQRTPNTDHPTDDQSHEGNPV
jgi:hypothetical protein